MQGGGGGGVGGYEYEGVGGPSVGGGDVDRNAKHRINVLPTYLNSVLQIDVGSLACRVWG